MAKVKCNLFYMNPGLFLLDDTTQKFANTFFAISKKKKIEYIDLVFRLTPNLYSISIMRSWFDLLDQEGFEKPSWFISFAAYLTLFFTV